MKGSINWCCPYWHAVMVQRSISRQNVRRSARWLEFCCLQFVPLEVFRKSENLLLICYLFLLAKLRLLPPKRSAVHRRRPHNCQLHNTCSSTFLSDCGFEGRCAELRKPIDARYYSCVIPDWFNLFKFG